MLRLVDCLPWALPGIYLIGAFFVTVFARHAWLAVRTSTRLALVVAAVSLAVSFTMTSGLSPAIGPAPVVCLLITFLGWVIGAYSHRYLNGESGQSRFLIYFSLTLAAVSSVVITTNLAVIILAWSASSVALHHLLTFYRDRPAAILVAHKKFLASRFAETLLVIAAILLYWEWGTLNISAISAHAQAGVWLPPRANVAAVLIAAAVLLKCAQLPLHGWLIQVMEAPTPVSALLHAGVVNLGGYVLIRLAPLIDASLAAKTLLVIVGSLTAAIAGLVMLTRITIKVRLAWSTCSQMGFMMMECGLGLYDLALLHLVSHALYKAYAFLTAGEAMRDGLTRRTIAQTMHKATHRFRPEPLLALPIAWAVAAGSASLWHYTLDLPRLPWIATALLSCGLATLLWTPAPGLKPFGRRVLDLAVGVQLYLGWHGLVALWIGVSTREPDFGLAVWSLLVFVALYLAQVAISISKPIDSLSRWYDWIYAGLYLDERMTRLTFWLWPPRLKPDAPVIAAVTDHLPVRSNP